MEPLAKTNPHINTEEKLINSVVRSIVSSSAAEGIIVDPDTLRARLIEHLRSRKQTSSEEKLGPL